MPFILLGVIVMFRVNLCAPYLDYDEGSEACLVTILPRNFNAPVSVAGSGLSTCRSKNRSKNWYTNGLTSCVLSRS